MNKYERIKQMTVDEMAEWHSKIYVGCRYCPIYDDCQDGECVKEFKQWLSREVEE